MPAPSPPEITEPREAQLWRNISRLYEDFCGDDESLYEVRTREFLKVGQVVKKYLGTRAGEMRVIER